MVLFILLNVISFVFICTLIYANYSLRTHNDKWINLCEVYRGVIINLIEVIKELNKNEDEVTKKQVNEIIDRVNEIIE